MIKKAITEAFKREIKLRAKQDIIYPILDLFKKSKYTGIWTRSVIVETHFQRIFKTQSRKERHVTMLKNRGKEAMINDCIWSPELANILDLTKEDVTQYYSYKTHLKITINTFGEEFKRYILKKARHAYQTEKDKADQYELELNSKEGTFLRSLLKRKNFEQDAIMPRLIVERKLYSRDYDGRTYLESLNDDLENLKNNRYNTDVAIVDGNPVNISTNKISDYAYRKRKNTITAEIKRTQSQLRVLYDRLFLDKEANVNFIFIRAIGLTKLSEYMSSCENLNVTSIRHGEDLLNEYCKWFNHKHRIEIKEEQMHRARLYKKNYSANKRAIKKLNRLTNYETIINMYESGESGASIGRLIGMKARTVTEIINRYLNGTLTRLGDEINVSVQGEEFVFNPTELNAKHQEQLLIQERKEKLKNANEKVIQFIIRKNNSGFFPSQISSSIHKTPLEVIKILKEHGMKHRFEYEFATDDEKNEQMKKVQMITYKPEYLIEL